MGCVRVYRREYMGIAPIASLNGLHFPTMQLLRSFLDILQAERLLAGIASPFLHSLFSSPFRRFLKTRMVFRLCPWSTSFLEIPVPGRELSQYVIDDKKRNVIDDKKKKKRHSQSYRLPKDVLG